MASTITAGTTSGTALNFAGDTSGILTVQGVTVGGTGGLGAGNASIMKNRLINGSMTIDQRNAGASVTITNTGGATYTLDRWAAYATQGSKYSVQQNAGSVTPPVGFSNYLGVTSLSSYSLAAGDYFLINQAIEGFNIADLGWGTANAKTVTLSFQVYSSLIGTFGGSIYNYASTVSYPFTYSIPVANTWTTISITIAGPTSGSFPASNSGSVVVTFGLGVGSTYSGTAGSWQSTIYLGATGATSVVGTNGATFYITGVQLEVGSSATGFEYRQYQQELALCQRYFQKWVSTNGSYLSIGNGLTITAGQINRWGFPLGIPLRASPTIVFSNCVGWDGAVGGAATITVNYSSTNNIDADMTTLGLGNGNGRAAKVLINGAASGYIETSGAEL